MRQAEFVDHLKKLAHDKAIAASRLDGYQAAEFIGRSQAYATLACFLQQNPIEPDEGIVVPRDVLDRLVGLAETVEDYVDDNEKAAVEWGQEKVYETIPK